jgi:hypothetical protein
MQPSGDEAATAPGDLSKDLDATVDPLHEPPRFDRHEGRGRGIVEDANYARMFYATKYIQAARFDSLTRNLSWRY